MGSHLRADLLHLGGVCCLQEGTLAALEYQEISAKVLAHED